MKYGVAHDAEVLVYLKREPQGLVLGLNIVSVLCVLGCLLDYLRFAGLPC